MGGGMRVVVRGNVGAEIGVLWASADRLRGKGMGRSGGRSDKSVQPARVRARSRRADEGAVARQPKRLGEMAEAAFLAKVSRLKFGVACPWGDSDRYDFIVDSGGRLWKVQVKSAHRAGEDGGYSFRLHGSSMAAYRADEIDVLVAYIASDDVWYVFPVGELGGLRSLKLYPGSRKKRSRFERYREGWWVMRAGKS